MSEDNKNLETKLRSVIETIDVANALTEPIILTIENLLKTSAAAMNSEEASVIVRDGDEGDLRFLMAIGKVAEKLINLKIPAGKGIAGFVYSSGQPMAITDVGEVETFYAEVDKQTGYSTQTILATPLLYKGEIIGVLEFVNRIGEPPYEPFTPDEMDRADLYAEAIAAIVNVYEAAKLFRDLGDKLLSGDESPGFREVREWLKNMRDSADHREMLDLALLLREIASRGESERRMCREILESVLRYSEAGVESNYLSY